MPPKENNNYNTFQFHNTIPTINILNGIHNDSNFNEIDNNGIITSNNNNLNEIYYNNKNLPNNNDDLNQSHNNLIKTINNNNLNDNSKMLILQ